MKKAASTDENDFGPDSGRAPKPFLKWAGGKRALLPRILQVVPSAIATYYEPFVGGGAVFFALARERRFKRAVLGDANEELVLCYKAVRDAVDDVIAALAVHKNDERDYYDTRALDPRSLSPAKRAARLIYLNRVGFNGLYRVNSRGEFNVPFGRYKSVVICDAERLRAASAALRQVTIEVSDFEQTVAEATTDDLVYFDPPYVPLSPTSSFTAYAQGRFSVDEQERLAVCLRRLGERGVRALLSNSDCSATRRLYKGLPRATIAVRRAINSRADGRGPVDELLVRSFKY